MDGIFRGKDGRYYEFEIEASGLNTFCAWYELGSFEVHTADVGVDDINDDFGPYDYSPDDFEIEEKDLYKHVFLDYCHEKHRAGRVFVLGDVKDGDIDKYIFKYVPKRPWVCNSVKFIPKLSAYYRNPNTGNTVRDLIVRTELAKEDV